MPGGGLRVCRFLSRGAGKGPGVTGSESSAMGRFHRLRWRHSERCWDALSRERHPGAAERVDVTQYAKLIERVRMAASMAQGPDDHARKLRREAAALREQGDEDAAEAKEEEAAQVEGKVREIDGACAALAVSAVPKP